MTRILSFSPLIVLALCCWQGLFAQGFQPFSTGVTVRGVPLDNPWAGGLNAPQLSTADFNRDGMDDLYVFDREGNVHLVFIAGTKSGKTVYTFNPAYAAAMPVLESWVLLRDYNGDGVKDIFAYSDMTGVDGLCVFTGYYEGDSLRFKRFTHRGPFNLASFPLQGSVLTPIYITRADYPAVDDVDCDGDLDLLTFNLTGGYCEWYKNQSVERGFGRDSLQFTLDNKCWGGFYESGLTEKIDLAATAGSCYKPAASDLSLNYRHAGSTLLTLDMDGDGDRELLLGDVSFGNMTLLMNGGDCKQAWMNKQENYFPANDVPIDITIFPAAFHLDIDQDGKRDLAVAPSARYSSENRNVLWWYRNQGSADKPRFILEQRDFLVGQMIDVGTVANPAFADVNGDGLLDLIVGNQALYHPDNDKDTRMFLFLNTGTLSRPNFTLSDEDWLNFSRFSSTASGFSPTFGDLDQDGDLDLVVGEEAGRLFFLQNQAGAGKAMSFAAPVFPYLNIDVGLASVPNIADVDGDNLQDLLVGERTGNVNFFRNVGSKGAPAFNANVAQSPNLQFFGGIDTRQTGYVSGMSAPALLAQGDSLLIVSGTEDLGIQLFKAAKGNLTGEFAKMPSSIPAKILGTNTRPALADLDADGFLEMAVGNNRGGLQLFKTPFKSVVSTSTKDLLARVSAMQVYPNPTAGTFHLNLPREIQSGDLQIFDLQGRLLRHWRDTPVNDAYDPGRLPSGWYALRFVSGEKVFAARLLVE
jgi:hypothetical protein